MIPSSVGILNTVAATAGDISVSTGKVSITNFPTVAWRSISKSNFNWNPVYTPATTTPVAVNGLKRALKEQSGSFNITLTTANNTLYAFAIQQVVNNVSQTVPFAYTSPASATDAGIGDALIAAINAASSLRVTATYAIPTAGTVVITVVAQAVANGGSAAFVVTPQAAVSVAATPSALLSNGGASAISAISNAAPRVVTFGAAHGLSNGNTIVISGLASGTGKPNVEGIEFEVEYATSTTVKLLGSSNTGTITVGSSANVYLTAQDPFGQYADVLASLVGAGSTSTPTAGINYAQLNLQFSNPEPTLLNDVRAGYDGAILWVAQGADSAVPTANFLAFETRIAQVLLCEDGSGAIDPQLLAVPAP